MILSVVDRIGPEFTLPAYAVTFVVGALLPWLVGFVTKITLANRWKALINLALSLIAGLITQATLNDGSAVISWNALVLVALTFITSAVTYGRLWRPALNINARTAPRFGIGPSVRKAA